MKKIITAFSLAFIGISSFAQTDAQKLDSAKKLIGKEQLFSAYKIITTIEKPSAELIHVAAGIILDPSSETNKYFAKFAVHDKGGQHDIVDFPLEDFLLGGIKLYPNDCRLYNDLSLAYNKFIYQEDLYTTLESLASIEKAVLQTSQSKCPDYLSNYLVGYCRNYLGRADSALPYLQRSIALNKNFAPAVFELANANLRLKNFQAALSYAKQAYALFPENKRTDRSRVAELMGSAYEGLNDNNNALTHYLMADSLTRYDFFHQKALLDFYVKTGNPKAPDALDAFLGAVGRTNLHYYADAIQIYRKYNHTVDLAEYCDKRIEQFSNRPEVQAALYFTKAVISPGISTSKQHLTKAKALGLKTEGYEPKRNHPDTRKMIDDALNLQ